MTSPSGGPERRGGPGTRRRRVAGRRHGSTLPRLAVLALSACASTASGLRAAEATADKDGIVAEMRVVGDGLKVDWRFVQTPPAPIESIFVTADGRPVPSPDGPVAAFPAPGQTAVVQVLSGRDDRSTLRYAAADLASDLPAGVTVRTATFEGGPDRPRMDALAAAIDSSLDDLGAETADRRALLLATGGADLASGPVLRAAARARAQDTPVFVVLDRTASGADREAATRLAQASGGALLDGNGSLASQVADTVLSGAELRFPFRVHPSLPWQDRTVALRASIVYGTRTLDLAASVDRPSADRGQAAAAIWNAVRPLVPGFLAGVGCAALVGSVFRARAIRARGNRT